jgi:hypothetical protein
VVDGSCAVTQRCSTTRAPTRACPGSPMLAVIDQRRSELGSIVSGATRSPGAPGSSATAGLTGLTG